MEKENKAGKRSLFNLFDIVLILIALALAALFLLGRDRGSSGTAAETSARTVTVHYTVEAADLDEAWSEAVKQGDPVVDRIKKYSVGTVEDVEVTPALRSVINYDAETLDQVEIPGRVTLYITIAAEAVVEDNDGDINIDGGYILKVGNTASLKTPSFTFSGAVVAVERIGA